MPGPIGMSIENAGELRLGPSGHVMRHRGGGHPVREGRQVRAPADVRVVGQEAVSRPPLVRGYRRVRWSTIPGIDPN